MLLLLGADTETTCLYMAPKCTLSALTEEEWGQSGPQLLISDRKKTFCQTNKNAIHQSARRSRSETAETQTGNVRQSAQGYSRINPCKL